MNILGTPTGSEEFIDAKIEARLADERFLWEAVSWVLDLQCAGPRCHHLLRTVPPSHVERYAQGHDEGNAEQKRWAHEIATLPMRVGGLELTSSSPHISRSVLGIVCRCPPHDIPAAPRGGQRNHDPAQRTGSGLFGRAPGGSLSPGSLWVRRQAPLGGVACRYQTFSASLAPRLATPGVVLFRVPSPRDHGVAPVVGCRKGPSQVPLWSGVELLVPRTELGNTVQPVLFRTLPLERMRLPVQVTESRCECGSPLDKLGRHRGACPRSARLRSRALPTERTMARVCREAGATVRSNCLLRDLNVAAQTTDQRAIEVTVVPNTLETSRSDQLSQ